MSLSKINIAQLITLCAFICLSVSSYGAEEKYSKRISGDQIQTSGSVYVQDGKFPQMTANSSWNTLFKHTGVDNVITLRVDLDKTEYLPAFTVVVDYSLNLTDENSSVVNETGSLSIQYDPTAGAVYTSEDANVYNDGHIADLTITNVVLTGITELPEVVSLENEIHVERYYLLKPYAKPAISKSIVDEEMKLAWKKIEGATHYEVQWTFIDNYDIGGSISASNLNYDFRWDASQITTTSNYMQIPILYDEGYIVYRVRAVGKYLPNLSATQYADWTLSDYGTVSSATGGKHEITSPLVNDDMNWSAVNTFGANGQFGSNVAYYDGTMRNRQTLSKNQTIDEAMLTETYYDHYGRPVINTLVAPTNDGTLEYYDAFNKNVAGTAPYSKEDFDKDDLSTSCAIDIEGMSTSHGTSKYYSYLNTEDDGAQGFVPQAERFPFTQIEYTGDNTGRVQRITLPGDAHSLESGHERELTYSTPSQVLLNHLFGTDVGLNESYTRITTTDENGQVTATYVDGAGRTIATSVVGEQPPNLVAADDKGTKSGMIEESLLEDYADFQITSSFAVDEPGAYDFTYRMTPESYTDVCIEGFCYDCHYDLNIRLIDLCGDVVEDEDYVIGPTTIDDVCSSITEFEALWEDVYLEKGSYTITKTLTLNVDYADDYAALYIEQNTCIDTYEDFLEDELASGFDLNCDATACELSCLDQHGTEEDYILGGGTAQQYYDLIEGCLLACAYTSPCEDLLTALEMDVLPGGQYALYYDQFTNTIDPSLFPLSVLNTSNQLGTNENWKYPVPDYKNSDGTDSYIEVNGVLVKPNHSSVTVEVFIQHYLANPQWAKSLVQYHPEYCFYESCLDNDVSGSNDWDYYFNLTQKFGTANAAGYFNPLNVTTAQGLPSSIAANTTNQDPFFQTLPGSVHQGAMIAAMQNYLTLGSSTYTIWQTAIVRTYCPTAQTETEFNTCLASAPTFGAPGCNEDALWEVYKGLYQSLKDEYVREVAIQYSIENYCYNGCIGSQDFDYDPNANGFLTSPYYNTSQPCHQTTAHLYDRKAARYLTNTTSNEPVLTLAQECEDECTAKAQYWIEALAPCSLGVNEAAIIAELIELCTLGCDVANMNGASILPTGTQTTNGNTSVDEVLAYHLGSSYMSELCSPWLISDPMPYGHDEAVSQSMLDECACDRILQNEYDFQNLSSAILGVDDGSDYFMHQYGVPLPMYDQYVCDCDGVYEAEYNTAWTPSATWNANAIAALEALSVNTMLNIGCNTCVDCDQISTAIADVVSLHGFSTNYDYYNIILTNYINSQYMTQFSVPDVLTFIDQCDIASSAGGTWCSNVYEEVAEVEDLLNDLIDNGDLLQPATTASNLNSISWFPSSYLEPYTVGHYFWADNATTSSSLSGDFNIGILVNSEEISECQLELDITGGSLPAYVNLGNMTEVDNIAATTGVNGMNKAFTVDATFEDPGSSATTTISIDGSSSCFPIKTCYIESELALCTPEIEKLSGLPSIDDCVEQQFRNAEYNASVAYQQYASLQMEQFKTNYAYQCSLAIDSEEWKREHKLYEYHFSLYYYDQAGNLIKTVPPMGVDENAIPMNTLASTNVDDTRDAGGVLVPNHTMATKYRHNTRNQVVETTSPDAGTVKYWYDNVGKLIYSQNAEQALSATPKYAYTWFDEHGRVIETGEVMTTADPNLSIHSADRCAVETFIQTGIRGQMTRIFYDKQESFVPAGHYNFVDGGLQNLTNRIATVAYYETYGLAHEYDNAYHYSYDEQGTVVAVMFELPELSEYGRDIKRTEYEYDLFSGNLTAVNYQGEYFLHGVPPFYFRHPDAFYTRYHYDGNNRLVNVETSKDELLWKQDAKYFYYDHGPLARVEIGDNKVHGQDFYYTIHGWLKGINSNTLQSDRDPGNDGAIGYLDNFNKIHKSVAEDAYGISLLYYDDDYSEIEPLATTDHPIASIASSDFGAATFDLYNGNIAHKVTSIQGLEIQGTAYRYDQLNRLKSMMAFQNPSSVTNAWLVNAVPDYATSYTYDPNGNLDLLTRSAISTALDMDDFDYTLVPGTNKLDYVDDQGTDYSTYEDVKKGQIGGNYKYNANGQLIKDVQEKISSISWKLNGNVDVITMTSGPTISFEYDAFGNRIKKHVQQSGSSDYQASYYVYDASGSPMAVYEHDYVTQPGGDYTYMARVADLPVYGASRVGVDSRNALVHERVSVASQVSDTPHREPFNVGFYESGKRQYELVDQVGNVHATVSDVKRVTDAETLEDNNFMNNILGWSAYPSGSWVTHDAVGYRMVVAAPNQNEGALYALSTIVGETYWVDLDIDVGTAGDVGYGVYEGGTANVLYGGSTTSSTAVGFYFVATTTSTDLKIYRNSASPSTFYVNHAGAYRTAFMADVLMKADYYPFGMKMKDRSSNIEAYRYGLNGMEKDNEVKGYGNSYTSYYRQYDPRLGRWFSTDPVVKPWESPYSAFNNNPIVFADPRGDDPISWVKNVAYNAVQWVKNLFAEEGIHHQYKEPGPFWKGKPRKLRKKTPPLEKMPKIEMPSLDISVIDATDIVRWSSDHMEYDMTHKSTIFSQYSEGVALDGNVGLEIGEFEFGVSSSSGELTYKGVGGSVSEDGPSIHLPYLQYSRETTRFITYDDGIMMVDGKQVPISIRTETVIHVVNGQFLWNTFTEVVVTQNNGQVEVGVQKGVNFGYGKSIGGGKVKFGAGGELQIDGPMKIDKTQH